MKYWRDVIDRVQLGDAEDDSDAAKKHASESGGDDSLLCEGVGDGRLEKRQRFYFDDDIPSLYFTRREVQCMYYLLHGCTIVKAAEKLSLSHRTVEFYVKNMKMKLNLGTKSELIQYMMKVGFLGKIDFEP